LQRRFYFPRQGTGLRDGPLRQQAGMNQCKPIFAMHQGTVTQPIQQRITIIGCQDRLQGIALVVPRKSLGHTEQMQIMIAQHGQRP